jgi:hypothetical protein
MQNIAIIRVIALDGLFGIYYTIRHKFGPQHATPIITMNAEPFAIELNAPRPT